MERIATLREQAAILRSLARSFDIATIRDQLHDIAARCESLAQSMENDPSAAGLDPERPVRSEAVRRSPTT
ncbi:MAG TPA: hypothetical protein VKU84_02820 [Stellaceae bacterium]|nr:hypothetical protein [Stellaceae bacterium]